MDSTTSVSKGVFLFSNGFNASVRPKKKSRQSILENTFSNEPWYIRFTKNWNAIEEQLKDLHEKTYSVLLNDIVSYLKVSHQENELDTAEGLIPSATLLTGVNQPDHEDQFKSLITIIREEVTPHVAMINSQDASSLKHLVENAVWQLINGDSYSQVEKCVWQLINGPSDMDCDENEEELHKSNLKKSRCTMKILFNWYQSKYVRCSPKKKKTARQKSLVIIIPDFESFNCNILQDFVMIISSYVSTLPITLVFGVATSVSALHKSFPYQVSSKLLIKVFNSHPSHVYMNQVLENIFITYTSPFHLSGKAFELLTDVFLFYDFSVTGLIQSIKYCMMEHYYADNTKILCCERDEIENAVSKLSSEDLENIRRLMSFRPFIEAKDCRTKISFFEDDDALRKILVKELHSLHDYMFTFYTCVRLFAVFVKDLPKNILGKSLREIYPKCASESISQTSGFKQCMQMLKFQSQVQLVETLQNAIKIVNAALQNTNPVKPLGTPSKNNVNNLETREFGEAYVNNIRIILITFLRQIENANNEPATTSKNKDVGFSDVNVDCLNLKPESRHKLKQEILKAFKVERIQTEFEMIRSRFVTYLEDLFFRSLSPPHNQLLHEIMFFTEVSNVKKQIVGAPRGALHMALSNPISYLQCTCCKLPSPESMSDMLPDVSLAYKLHRECGKHINLYDWLQAFAAVLCPEEDENRAQDPTIQVRFTRAVAELQFLGFIKTSKRKTDHVMRLTW